MSAWDRLLKEIAIERDQIQKLVDYYRPAMQRSLLDEPRGYDTTVLGAFLHSFFSGIENILKRIAVRTGGSIPSGPSSHSALIDSVSIDTPERFAVLSPALGRDVREYMRYRHLFRSLYPYRLMWERMRPLIENAEPVWNRFQSELDAWIERMQEKS